MRLVLFLLFFFICVDASAANRFLTCNTTCTITASDTTIWGTTTGGTGASVPGSSDAVVLDGATCVGGTTCTATMGSSYNPTWQSITMGACTASTTGCIFDWSVNNNNVTLTASSAFSGSGSGTRNLKMGNGTWSFTNTAGNSTPWNMQTTTNLTFSAGSSVLTFSGPASGVNFTFTGGGLTYSTVTFAQNSGSGSWTIGGANTFSTFNITAPAYIQFPSSTQTITNAFNWAGTSTNQIGLLNTSVNGTATISVSSGSPTISWASIRDMTFSGGATFTATSSFSLGHNSGVTITAPVTGGGGIISGANDNWSNLEQAA